MLIRTTTATAAVSRLISRYTARNTAIATATAAGGGGGASDPLVEVNLPLILNAFYKGGI